ncbi:MAG: hypothetical protein NTY19_37645, partial [Planctomycetota bacterium]|nr:hypothetical protein [Planctomycetota bacterium]
WVSYTTSAGASRTVFRRIPPAASGGGRDAAEEVRRLRTRDVVQKPRSTGASPDGGGTKPGPSV